MDRIIRLCINLKGMNEDDLMNLSKYYNISYYTLINMKLKYDRIWCVIYDDKGSTDFYPIAYRKINSKEIFLFTDNIDILTTDEVKLLLKLPPCKKVKTQNKKEDINYNDLLRIHLDDVDEFMVYTLSIIVDKFDASFLLNESDIDIWIETKKLIVFTTKKDNVFNVNPIYLPLHGEMINMLKRIVALPNSTLETYKAKARYMLTH